MSRTFLHSAVTKYVRFNFLLFKQKNCITFDKATDKEKKQTILVAGATGNIGRAAAQALALSRKDRGAMSGKLYKLYRHIEKGDKAMKNKIVGKRLWKELVVLTGLDHELDTRPT